MRARAIGLAALSLATAWVLAAQAATQNAVAQPAATRTTFVRLGNGVPGVLYEPANAGPKAGIAVFVMHSTGDYLQFTACTELSKRGYRVLCANNTTGKSGAFNDFTMDRALLDAKLGVAWLRQYPGVRKVVLLGHSGGGVLMSSYQGIAEGGLQACQGPEKILKCPDSLAGLPPADGLMLLDSNFGTSTMTLFSLDPSVIDPTSGKLLDPALDLYNPRNGFDAKGAKYDAAFARRYQSAVSRRSQQLIRMAQDRLQKIEAGQGRYGDDEPFDIPGGSSSLPYNKFFAQDPSYLSQTSKPWLLLHKDGTATTEIVHTVRVPEGLKPTTFTVGAALKTTVRGFLGTYAMRAGDDYAFDASAIRGVDWTSSYTTPPGMVRSVKVPLLTVGMTGHWEYLAAEFIYENAASADKTIAFVEGASHEFTPCRPCEKTPGQFGDTVKTLFDFVDGWLGKPGRF